MSSTLQSPNAVDVKPSVNRDGSSTALAGRDFDKYGTDAHQSNMKNEADDVFGGFRSRSLSDDEDPEDIQTLLDDHRSVGEKGGSGNSISIIFSLWSVMIGSTILIMPRMARETGIYTAVFGTLLICILNSYTAVLMERLGTFYKGDCSHVVNQFGKIGYYLTTPASVLIFVGAMIIYESYITNAVTTLAKLDPDENKWRVIVSCSIGGLMFFIGLLRSIKPLVRVASGMVLVVTFMIIFIVAKSGWQMSHHSCVQDGKVHGLGWTGFESLVELLSAMSLSLFCHNMITSITNESTNKRRISRDITIAFFCTAISNIGPAVFALYAFRHCAKINEDFLSMFDDPFATAARVGISLLVSVVFPILLFNARSQALQMLFGPTFPYWAHIAFNLICLASCTAPVAAGASTTMIAAIAGVCALVFTLTMPVYMWVQHNRRHSPESCTVPFYIVHALLFGFGVALMVLTIMSEAGVKFS